MKRAWQSLPLFWRLQIAGWLAFAAVITLFKALVLDNPRIAITSTLLQEPFSFLLTVALHQVYRRIPANAATPGIALKVMGMSLVAALIDATYFETMRNLFYQRHELVLPGERGMYAIGTLRFMLYICWSFLYFWARSLVLGMQAKAAADAADLRALRAHLNPHFLFNALNAIAAEAEDNPKAVRGLALELASYLRYSLSHREADSVPLGAELDAMDSYLRVEKVRFEERLHYNIEATPEARAARVPGFFLQPLVENAVKHGMRGEAAALKLLIRAACTDGTVRIEVGNTGSWLVRSRPPTGPEGFGLESIRQRLQLQYPGRHRFEIDRGETWVNVAIEVPRS